MKAIDRPFTKIIDGTTQFVIPVFQRDYNWTETVPIVRQPGFVVDDTRSCG